MESQLAKTRRRLRSRGTTRRRTLLHGGLVKVNGDAAAAILTPIYNTLPATKAAGQHNLTYGEIEWPSIKIMLDYAEKQSWPSTSPGRFYDLGCGRGRSVLYMALAGPFDFSVGVEVLPERVTLAQEALIKLKAAIPTAGAKVKLYEASFLNPAFKYKDARMIFLSNMCFDEETQRALFNKLNVEMQKDSLVFCSRLPSPVPAAFESIGMEKASMTWTHSSELHILRHL